MPTIHPTTYQSVSTSTASGGGGIAEEQQRLATSLLASAVQQQQQLQNAVAKLLGQNFPGSSTPTTQTILQQSTPNLQNFQQNLQPSPSPNYAALLQQQQQFDQLQSQLASAIAAQQQQQRIPNAALSVNIQTALAAAAS
uniref:Uncharacterized protein n=1 Tax=Meloidogyne javanica TaxID=6303 RepID=A0A915LQ63_MELJA